MVEAEGRGNISDDAQKSVSTDSGNKTNSFLASIPPPGRLFIIAHILILVGALIGCGVVAADSYPYTHRGSHDWGVLALFIFLGLMAAISLVCLAGAVRGIRGLGMLGCIVGVFGGLYIAQALPLIVLPVLMVYGGSGLSIASAMFGAPAKSPAVQAAPEALSPDFDAGGTDAFDRRGDTPQWSGKYPIILKLLFFFCIVEIVRAIPTTLYILSTLLKGSADIRTYTFLLLHLVLPLSILFYVWKRNRPVVLIFLFIRMILSCYVAANLALMVWRVLIFDGPILTMLQEFYLVILVNAYNVITQLVLFILIAKSRQVAKYFNAA